jgi:hypothetical protein
MRRENLFATIRTEGGLLPADLLARIAEGDKTLEGLDPTGYHLAPGERLNEAVSRSWNRLLGAWENFATALAEAPESDRTATALTRNRWTQVLFQELGYGQLQTAKALAVDGKEYPVSHLWEAVLVHLVGARVDLDRRTSGVAGAARMSPHGLVQELLNRSDAHLWGFVSNGLRLRLLRDNVSLTRQAFVEFDLEAMLTGQAYADFVVLWLLCHQSRVEGDIPEKCLLECWSADAAQRGTRALDQLRGAVESAIATMGEGFLAHPANGDLRDRLRTGLLDRQNYYRQLLRLVYRLLFVSVAEARDVLNDPAANPTDKERYRRFYSLERIRELAETRRGGPHSDLWAQLQLLFRALGAYAGCPELALPSLGSFLWSADATPNLDNAQLANRHLLAAVRTLSSTQEGKVTRTVDYRNLGSEELGSVYESLLELHPEVNVDARTFSLSTASGHERKTTGSYYTPSSLIKELLDSALDPVLAEAAAAPDPEAAILNLKVLDPAVGSGHFLIAAGHRIARRLASIRTGDEEPSPNALRRAVRDVVGHCLHGIDINPMAVELCKVSLWMEAVEPGKPLSFLDHRIVLGNSLLGTTPRLLAEGLPDEAFKPLTGDDKATVSALRKRNAAERKSGQQVLGLAGGLAELARPLAAEVGAIDALPDDTFETLREKEQRYAALVASDASDRARLAADTWCAAFVIPKLPDRPAITDAVIRQIATAPEKADPIVLEVVRQTANRYRFLHMHLAFPHVFPVLQRSSVKGDTRRTWEPDEGGFQVVLGNPPWDRVKIQEKEFFAERSVEIASAPNAAARKRLIRELPDTDPLLHQSFVEAVREADGVGALLRASGRYPLCGRGDVNTYAVFSELGTQVLAIGGRLGIIVPSGIATDESTSRFFSSMLQADQLVSYFDFVNDRGLFPDVGHGNVKFCLLTLGSRGPSPARFSFFRHFPSELRDEENVLTLTAEDIWTLNPNTRTLPIFRQRQDLTILKRIYRRVPILVDDASQTNSWGVKYMSMFHMANDSSMFIDAATVGSIDTDQLVVLYEGKMINIWDHRWGENAQRMNEGRQSARLPSEALRRDPLRRCPSRYLVPRAALDARVPASVAWFLGFRDVCRSVDNRTLIPSVFPRAAAGHKLPVLLFDSDIPHCLIANLSSIPLDYCVRLKHNGTSLALYIVKQLPVLEPAQFTRVCPWDEGVSISEWIRPRVLELAYTSWDLSDFGVQLGYHGPPFIWSTDRRSYIDAELNACFFHLYGLDVRETEYMLDTFVGLSKFEKKTYGEFRTKRLIVDRFNEMARCVASREVYRSVLDPPPANASVAHSI